MTNENIRPTKEQIKLGRENGWSGKELKYGYGIFQDGDEDFKYVARIDDMEVFSNDIEAAKQAAKDGLKFLELTNKQGKAIWCDYGHLPATILDTAHNRKLLKKIK